VGGLPRAVAIAALAAAFVVSCGREIDPARVLRCLHGAPHVPLLVISYPFDGSIFPPEIVPPIARWDSAGADVWVVAVELAVGDPVMAVVDTPQWALPQWERIKAASQGPHPARLVVAGLRRSRPDSIARAGMVRIRTSTDSVGDALFYREVNLPFGEAVRDPSRIRWRFGPISYPQAPPSVLEGLPVCGNCHSFSADGRVLGMDVDYANDKGSYAMVETAERMVLSRDRILTWCDYRREDGQATFGLLSQVSPDGRWIVFCRASSFMLLQPDSRLHIMPSPGGEARAMRCNTPRMNSWHSWSSNSRWLVFASKAFTPYTQLFLTHVDSRGMDAPPVLLEHLTSPDRAANIPEFVRLAPGAIAQIRERFVDDLSWMRASREFYKAGDLPEAERASRKALELNPDNAAAHAALGAVLGLQRRTDEALGHLRAAVRLDSTDIPTRYNLGVTLAATARLDSAREQFRAVIRLQPGDTLARERMGSLFRAEGRTDSALAYFRAVIRQAPGLPSGHHGAGSVLQDRGENARAAVEFRRALQADSTYDPARQSLAAVLQLLGRPGEAQRHYRSLLDRRPGDAMLHYQLGRCLHEQGRLGDAVVEYRIALQLKPDLAAAQRQLDEALEQGRRPAAD